ncbi:MAG: hypothetical protein AB7P21_23475 [Lautropia sp.]
MRLPALLSRSRTLAAALCTTAAWLAGCATGGAPPARSAASPFVANAGHEVEIEVADAPNFYADTSARRFFGFAGVIAMAVEGNRIVRELGIPDPALDIAATLRERLAARSAATPVPTRTAFVLAPRASRDAASDTAQAAATASRQPPPSRWKVSVRTVNWDFRPFRDDDAQLVIVYAARVELENATSGEVLSSQRCEKRRSPAGEVTVERLLADGGRVLREELAAAGRACLDSLNTGAMAASLGLPTSVAQR